MRKPILLYLLSCYAISLSAQNFIGNWKGDLQVQGGTLPLLFHITEIDNQLRASMDSPNQGAFGIAIDTCYVQDQLLLLKSKSLMMVFTGKIENGELVGTFQQGPIKLPLTMKQISEENAPSSRPQDPKPPFPYQQEEVTFSNPAAGIRLAGTLTRPQDRPAKQIIIMISGSGPQDRNSEILNHRPFWVWADYLTRRGIAVLRFDERGIGDSEGNFSTATSQDFASDVQAAVDFISSRKEFQNSSIGLLGHSEGGLVAPMVALNRPEQINFLLLLAAPGVPIIDLMYEQNIKVAEGQGMVEPMKTMFLNQQKAIFELVSNTEELSTVAMRDTIFTFYEQRNGGTNLRENPQVKKAVDQFSSPWMRYFLAYNPQPNLQKLQIPVLAINGDKDTQVIASQNIQGIEYCFNQGGNHQLTTHIFPGLNHLFQAADTGQAAEYAQIEETVNPAVLAFVTQWVLSLE